MTLSALFARVLIHTGIVRLMPRLHRRLEGGVDSLRYFSDRLLDSPLRLLEQLSSNVHQDSPEVIDLSAAIPRFELTSSLPRLPIDRRGWPEPNGLPELRGAIAAHMLREHQVAISPADELLVTSGALGALQIIVDAFVNRYDRVVLFDPCSPIYSLILHTRGASIRWVNTRLEGHRIRPNFDQLRRALFGARLLILNTPNNPTGGLFHAEELEQIVWWAKRHDVLLVSDEVFERFTFEGEFTSLASLPMARERSLIVNSVSKSCGLTSARVGWIAANRHLLRPCKLTAGLRMPFVPTWTQLQALAALNADEENFQGIHDQFDSHRRYTLDRLHSGGFDVQLPASGMYFWLDSPEGYASGEVYANTLYTQHRVRVTPGNLFGPSGKRKVRLCFCADEGRLEEGLNRITATMSKPRLTFATAA